MQQTPTFDKGSVGDFGRIRYRGTRWPYAILRITQTRRYPGPLAQLVEHRTFNPGVVGSTPTRPTSRCVTGQAIRLGWSPVPTCGERMQPCGWACMDGNSLIDVKIATRADRDAVLDPVGNLLTEMGGTPPPVEVIGPVFDRFAVEPDEGFVVLGESDGRAIAVCTVSLLEAMRTRGRYAIVQEMVVEPEWRSTGVGMEVLKFALDYTTANGCQTVELGTPYRGERQTEFYQRAGFSEVGARLRWRVSS